MSHDNNFDLLRLAAAVSVLFSHAFLLAENSEAREPFYALSGGQTVLGIVGVFVFFTISGFLVTQSFMASRSPLQYLQKRALRIYPGLLVCLLFCAFVVGPAITSLSPSEYWTSGGLWDFLGANAILNVEHNRLPGVSFTATDLGGIVDGPLWSLPCEVLMYFLVAALGWTRRLALRTALVLLGAGLLAIFFDARRIGTMAGDALWLLGFFAAGMALYFLQPRRVLEPRGALFAAAALALSIPAHQFILCFALFGSYLVLYLALLPKGPRLPKRLGDLSYGLYIYGWPAQQLVLWYHDGAAPWWEVFLLGTAGAGILAFLSWHLIEQPALLLKPRAVPAAPAETGLALASTIAAGERTGR